MISNDWISRLILNKIKELSISFVSESSRTKHLGSEFRQPTEWFGAFNIAKKIYKSEQLIHDPY